MKVRYVVGEISEIQMLVNDAISELSKTSSRLQLGAMSMHGTMIVQAIVYTPTQAP